MQRLEMNSNIVQSEVLLNGCFLTVASPPISTRQRRPSKRLKTPRLREHLLSSPRTINPVISSPLISPDSSLSASNFNETTINSYPQNKQQTPEAAQTSQPVLVLPEIAQNEISIDVDFSGLTGISDTSNFVNLIPSSNYSATQTPSEPFVVQPLNSTSFLRIIDPSSGQPRLVCFDNQVTEASDGSSLISVGDIPRKTNLEATDHLHTPNVLQNNTGNIFTIPTSDTTSMVQVTPTEVHVMPERSGKRKISRVAENIASTENTISATSRRVSGRKRFGGWPKGKKRRTISDKSVVPPLTGYVIYAKQRRQELSRQKSGLSFHELTRVIGSEWSNMDAVKKTHYLELAEKDLDRFKGQVRSLQKTDSYKRVIQQRTKNKLGALGEDEQFKVLLEPEDSDESTLYCKVCDQFFGNHHNKNEHMIGKYHMNRLNDEIVEIEKKNDKKTREILALERDNSVDIIDFMEGFIARNSERELELETLRSNLSKLKDSNTQLHKQIQILKETDVKLRQELQPNKKWFKQLHASMENLKMVPTLFGVVNF